MAKKQRLLFVDDEPSIRMTLPAILEMHGFDVVAAATVPEALQFIAREEFDVLIADLNIGAPSDGFTVVSAMRRTQPDAVTLILTGYPDFQSALEAIRQQVDDYLTKPADIKHLVESIKEKLERPRRARETPSKRVATVLDENSKDVIESWLAESKNDAELGAVEISDRQRTDHLPALLANLTKMVEAGRSQPGQGALNAAARHGTTRAEQGYSIPMLMEEARILQNVISTVVQGHLLEIDVSTLVGDVMKIGENLNAILAASVRAFLKSQTQSAA